MAFSVVILVGFGTRLSFANGESLPGGRPGILRTIVEDATVYFLVIFSSHFVSLVMVFVARVSLNVFLRRTGRLVPNCLSLLFNPFPACEFIVYAHERSRPEAPLNGPQWEPRV